LWFWACTFAATVLWWVVMLFRVALIGPVELLAMFRSLQKPHEDETLANQNRSA
jgi:hypothetical protein